MRVIEWGRRGSRPADGVGITGNNDERCDRVADLAVCSIREKASTDLMVIWGGEVHV